MKFFRIIIGLAFTFSFLVAFSWGGNIHQAVIEGDLEAVRTMLDAEPKLLESRNADNLTPLHLAAINGHIAISRLLLEKGVEVDAGDKENSTALHNAAARGHEEIVSLLVNQGAGINRKDDNGMTPLHFACSYGRETCARILLEKGADGNAREINGRTPLFFTARRGSLSICKLLTAKGARADVYNKFDRGPLLYAVWGGHPEIMRFLIGEGADLDKKDSTGLAPLHYACLERSSRSARILIESGADMSAPNREGHTPLHSAAYNGIGNTVALLVAAGADVSAVDRHKDTPLHGAAWHGDLQAVDALLEKNADINARNSQGRTPLDYAVKTGQDACVQTLRDRGAVPGTSSSLSIKRGKIPQPVGEGETDPIKMTVIYDNTVAAEGIKGEWGFSCFIEGTEKTILFDTGGNAETFQHNVSALNIDLDAADTVVISHDHWDHINGLPVLLKTNRHAPIYIPYQFPYNIVRGIESESGEVVPIDEPEAVCEHVYLTGQMGDRIKEQSLIVNTPKGLIIVTGCSHQGIVNILKKAKQVLNREIYMVFGGFHLMGHSEEQVASIIRNFKELGVQKCGATHCTGETAIRMFKDAYGDDYVEIGAGRVLRFGEKQVNQ